MRLNAAALTTMYYQRGNFLSNTTNSTRLENKTMRQDIFVYNSKISKADRLLYIYV